MRWTTDKPTKPGWHFVQRPEDDHEEMLKLEIDDSSETVGEDLSYWLLNDGQGSVTYLADDPVGTKYAGPIAEPTDEFDFHEYADREIAKNGLSARGFVSVLRLGLAAYEEALRQGAYFPHH
jgi:hypothetical protein